VQCDSCLGQGQAEAELWFSMNCAPQLDHSAELGARFLK
jgi:hypothetical protein